VHESALTEEVKAMTRLRVVIVKPSKYGTNGYVERFRRGFMPNSSLPYLRSLTPDHLDGTPIDVFAIDEYVYSDLQYLSLLRKTDDVPTLVALVGVQSHQFHRALDLGAYARENGCLAVMGGPHPITCDTSELQGGGISFCLSEAELVWPTILRDALAGELQPVYGQEQRWMKEIEAPVLIPPERRELRRYAVPMLGVYPSRGCPYICSYCSVIKISGRRVRSQSVATTIASLRAAERGGIKFIMFTSDNFNKYPEAETLLQAMIEERINLRFFIQSDTQIVHQERFLELLARAGCFQIFLGTESFNRSTLVSVRKKQNRPELYQKIVELCRENGISSHFANILGFPQDDEAAIEEHVETLLAINPTWASFYILCPIPGTDQYADFLEQDLIVEKNLDRFDTTCLTWRHPSLSRERLHQLLFRSYSRFYSIRHGLDVIRRSRGKGLFASRVKTALANTLFHKYSCRIRFHPVSGGLRRVAVDRAEDYLPLRRRTFGFDLAPLPRNLEIPQTLTRLGPVSA
jgi:radical SAM superfamily enzyme YgiQ (UPF0313 family)